MGDDVVIAMFIMFVNSKMTSKIISAVDPNNEEGYKRMSQQTGHDRPSTTTAIRIGRPMSAFGSVLGFIYSK